MRDVVGRATDVASPGRPRIKPTAVCRFRTRRSIEAIDSTGLSVFGEDQWAAAEHGKRGFQGCKKLHLEVDDTGMIVAEAPTGPNVDDAKTGVRLIKKAAFKVKGVIADAA